MDVHGETCVWPGDIKNWVRRMQEKLHWPGDETEADTALGEGSVIQTCLQVNCCSSDFD